MAGYFANERLNSMSPEMIRELQEERLRTQMEYCYRTSNFYNHKFREAGAEPGDITTLDDLHNLPIFMDKAQERKNAEESLSKENHPFGTHLCAKPEDVFLTGTTSGTTGTPTFSYTFTHDDIENIAKGLGHRFSYNGLAKGDRILFIFALGIYATTMSLWGIRSVGALPIDIDSRAGSEMMLRFAVLTTPKYMATTVSLSEYLIDKAPEIIGKEVRSLNLQGLFVTGEVGVSIPEIKRRIEKAYGCPVYDYWAPTGHAIGVSCKAQEYSGLHGVAPDLCTSFDDLVDPDTKLSIPVTNGAIGEMVITSLNREACPLIRYATGDIIQVFTEPCPYCGFPGKRAKMVGRADDMLIVKGVNVYPAAIKTVVESFAPAVTGEMRVVLETRPPRVVPPLKLKIEAGPQTDDADLTHLSTKICQALHDQLKIRPVIEWVKPGTLEKSTHKTPLFEKRFT